MDDRIRQIAAIIDAADALLVTAGAGMGVDSGLPDFRGKEGFWKAYPVVAKLGLSFEQMANPDWFDRDPNLAWAFYGHRLHLYRDTAPHSGFAWLRELGQKKKHGCFVFTSNVDGHFQKAGFDPNQIVECHGSIHHLQCSRPCSPLIWDAAKVNLSIDVQTFRAAEPLPYCSSCHSVARPNILMFGDWTWLDARTEAQRERFTQWLEVLRQSSAKIVVIEIGAGTAVATIRRTSEGIVQQLRGTLVRINPREPDVPSGQYGLPMHALAALRKILGGSVQQVGE